VYGQCILSGADAAALCGNGNLDKERAGEQCDAGSDPEKGNSDTAPNRCRSNCSSPSCGDGVTDDASKEQCDAGDFNSNVEPNRCRNNCTLPVCGDQVIDTAQPFNEQCDEGKGNSPAKESAKPNLCRNNCLCPVCGDGVTDNVPVSVCADVSIKEVCDDGEANSDAPNARCRVGTKDGSLKCTLARCGDGIVDTGTNPPGVPGHTQEKCDDGDGPDDPNTLKVEGNSLLPNALCRPQTCQFARCGDGIIDTSPPGRLPESCDPGKPETSKICTDNNKVCNSACECSAP